MHVHLDQPFAELTAPQRRAVLAWARSHDWGGYPARWTGAGALRVSCVSFTADGGSFTESFDAGTLRQLRDWAGY